MEIFAIILAIAILVAALHMVAPDHWVPLIVVADRTHLQRKRVYGMAGFLGILHAGTSATVALLVLYVGLILIHGYVSYLNAASIALLIVVGLYFAITGYRENESEIKPDRISTATLLSVSIFPDFALVPILLSAVSLTSLEIGVIILSFALASAVSLIIMVFGVSLGFSKAIEKMPPKYIDYIISVILWFTALFVFLFEFS